MVGLWFVSTATAGRLLIASIYDEIQPRIDTLLAYWSYGLYSSIAMAIRPVLSPVLDEFSQS